MTESIIIPDTIEGIEWAACASSPGLCKVYFEGSREAWDTMSPDTEAFGEEVAVLFLSSGTESDPLWQYGSNGVTPEPVA